MAGVVGLGVVVEQGAGERLTLERGGDLAGPRPGELLVPRRRARATHGVVEREPRCHVWALPPAARERVEERHRTHEVRRKARQHQLALLECLADEVEVHLLEVAQAAVEELGRS